MRDSKMRPRKIWLLMKTAVVSYVEKEWSRAKKLSCGHVFHLNCLRTWLQHQQTCPLCRSEIAVSSTDGPGGGDRQRREQRALAAAVAAAERIGDQLDGPQREGDGHAPGQLNGEGNLVQQINARFDQADAGGLQREQQENAGSLRQRRPQHEQNQAQDQPAAQLGGQGISPDAIPRAASSARTSSKASTRGLLAKPATSNSTSSTSRSSTLSLPRSHHRNRAPDAQVGIKPAASTTIVANIPGFFVSQSRVSVHQTPATLATVLRSLPPGVIVFVEACVDGWMKLPDGWVEAVVDSVELLLPYVDTDTPEVSIKLNEMQARKSMSRAPTVTAQNSVLANLPSNSSRMTRILRMQKEMSRLQQSLQVVQTAMGRLSEDLVETLQEEMMLQVQATSPSDDFAVKNSLSAVSNENTDSGGSGKNFTGAEDHSIGKKSAAQNNVETMEETPVMRKERSVENSSRSAFDVPVATRSASTPSRLPGSNKSSPFGHLTRGQVPSTPPLSASTPKSEERRALPREINNSDEKKSPQSNLRSGAGTGTGTDVEDSVVRSSSDKSHSSSASTSDVRSLRAKYYSSANVCPTLCDTDEKSSIVCDGDDPKLTADK
mmetsp:Transcript_19528/g.36396  ORF Transcript_19528/g.36396 Transcript_19528/m.36396 type:complete len:605 (+) Transcript_19528:856-2670(+)